MSLITKAAVPAFLLGLSMAVGGHEVHEKVQDPGFRPASEFVLEFQDSIDTATVAVLPTIVRRQTRSVQWSDSQQQLVAELSAHDIGSATSLSRRFDPGPVTGRSQWELFNATLDAVSELVRSDEIEADYVVLLEVIVPDGQSVFGIQVYILNSAGRNVFSFLLNSHHQVFADANLVAGDTSEAARSAMIEAATRLAVTALVAQIDLAKDCASRMAIAPVKPAAGVLEDFESGLGSGSDANGISLGFVTFGDDNTSVSIATTNEYPPKPEDPDGTHVLKMNLDVASWGGMAKTHTNSAVNVWTPLDWSDFDGFSLWVHGSSSGAELYIHILDNRHPCSTVEDAERFGIEFTDDFSGWRQLTVRFDELERREVWNGAPDDGLGLTRVHGWALGSGKTGQPLTIYMDDFALWQGEAD